MKTVAMRDGPDGSGITLELTEFELTVLAALVEEGRKRLSGAGETTLMQVRMEMVAEQFTHLLGHLELLRCEDE